MEEKTILLVEDSSDDEVLTLRALRKSNVASKVIVVRDGAAALDYLLPTAAHRDNVPALPAIVLLDLKLPKVDGLEVLRQLRAHERTSLLPIIVLTSSDEERDIVESYSLRANSFIRKPVDFEQFIDAVRQLEMYWLTLNTAPPQRDA